MPSKRKKLKIYMDKVLKIFSLQLFTVVLTVYGCVDSLRFTFLIIFLGGHWHGMSLWVDGCVVVVGAKNIFAFFQYQGISKKCFCRLNKKSFN